MVAGLQEFRADAIWPKKFVDWLETFTSTDKQG